jgi:hypothetical protein
MTLMSSSSVTKRVDEAEVMAIPAPEWTDTWHPVSHGLIINALGRACHGAGIEVTGREYSVNEPGTRMFGVWNLALGNGAMQYALGFRNSTDKTMVVGITAGTNVLVCDNLCFSGDFIAFRKHTSGLDEDELRQIAAEAVKGAVVKMDRFYEWHKSLHKYYVPRTDLKVLTFDMINRGVFSGGQFSNFMSALDEERAIIHGTALDGATSLYSVHGAATRLMRTWNLLRVSDATKLLNGVCDDYLLSRAA